MSKEVKKQMASKRFIIRKSLIGKGIVVKYTNYDGKVYEYDHDKVYEINKERFDNMKCFIKYKYYSQTYDMPRFVRDMDSLV